MSGGGAYGDQKPKAGESTFDVDQALESRYNFDRGADRDMSVLAIVSAYQDELAEEFFAWWEGRRFGNELARDALQRFECVRFGAELFPSARGLLWGAVRRRLAPSPRKALPAPKPPEPRDERLRRFDEAAGRLAQQKSMEVR
jgi:hypothetical protein